MKNIFINTLVYQDIILNFVVISMQRRKDMVKNSIISVQGVEISVTKHNEDDYICITDMVAAKEGNNSRAADIIKNWIRNRSTIEFLGTWESVYNPNFKVVEFDHFKKEAGLPTFTLSVSNWVEKTNAIGIFSKKGKYGGTYAHKDIAFEFGTAISPVFKLYLIKEFQRLKEEEEKQLKSAEWLFHRFTTKANYSIQTDAVQKYIIPNTKLPKEKHGIIYADEAELINFATLGYTSKEWIKDNPEKTKCGNLRDYLSVEELIVLDNMQSYNSILIREGLSQQERLLLIQKASQRQFESLQGNKTIAKAKELSVKKEDFDIK